ncbi:chaplin [Streptomyces sp. 7N604]|uniref:chaplin n=1 Tax=Streptomyces sp. 7N604 TaxID=3457415 RepID=UPI003FCF2C95
MSRMAKAIAVTAAAGAVVAGVAGTAVASSDSKGAAVNSGGVISGNVIQIPLHIPINICGNNFNEGPLSIGNATIGNVCINAENDHHDKKHDKKHEKKHDKKSYKKDHGKKKHSW